jgi:CRISPR-associated exonuclease Cas4
MVISVGNMNLITKELVFNGTQVNYYIVCSTKLWYFSHFLQMEQNSDLVELGKLIHETSFEKLKKDVQIDSKISIDFVERGNKIIIHDVKKSKKLEKAHIYQLLYYLYYLKQKGIKAEGEINYPKIRKIEKIDLTEKNEEEIEAILKQIKEIISLSKPPKPEKKKYCRKCSYFELCWC